MRKNIKIGLVGGCCFLIIIFAVIGTMTSDNTGSTVNFNTSNTSTSNSNNATATNTTATSGPVKTAGEYKVGSDIPAGEYYLVNTGGNMYTEVATDSSGDLNSIDSNFNTAGNAYITVKDGEYLKVTGGNIYNVNGTEHTKATDGYYPEGMYKVGVDIPAGEYTLEATGSNGYVEVSTNSKHSLNSISTNDNFENNTIVTLEDGDYVLFSGAKLKAN